MWTIDSTRIYTTDLTGGDKQIIARLQPLGGGTVTQVFGYEDSIVKVRSYVVGDTDLHAIQNMAKDGATHTLVGNAVTYGSYLVSNVSWSRVPALYQTLTTDCYAPLYQVEMELYL